MPTVAIKHWGNSNGIVLPKVVMNNLNWNVGDSLNFETKDETLVLKKVAELRTSRKSPSIEEIFSNWREDYQKVSDWEFYGNEIDWGKPRGNEIW